MLKIFVDSGSSIKVEEKETYQIEEIFPLRYLLGDKEYRDGVDLSMDEFYKIFIEENLFPKTSLPDLDNVLEKVNKAVENGDDCIILTISSGISGTYNAIYNLFKDNKKVKVIDTKSAVGGVRILVEEINKNRDKSLDELEEIVNNIIPRLKIIAVPENLNYLLKGGRLSKQEWAIGTVLHIKPLITFVDGKVTVEAKKIGLRKAMQAIATSFKDLVDTNYLIVPSYTYDKKNLDDLMKITDSEILKNRTHTDNLIPSISCHWGPCAFGYIYVAKEKVN